MKLNRIKNASPLNDYWKSDQNDLDETNRILKSNKASKASYLFEKEPYKWENLFQSISQEIINGDNESIKGLKVLLDCLNKEEREKVIIHFKNEDIFKEEVIKELKKPLDYSKKTKSNPLRFLRILFSIFTNPYELDLKRKKIHAYEKTGYLANVLRKMLSK